MTAPGSLFPVYATVILTGTVLAGLFALPHEAQVWLKEEGGPIEMVSAILFFVAAAILAPTLRKTWPFFLLLVAFGLRELDMDKRPFTLGLLKSRQYLSDAVPVLEKAISVVLLLGLVAIGVIVIARGARPALRGLRTGNDIAWNCLLALCLGVTAKAVDGFGRKLEGVGLFPSASAEHGAVLYEETAELGMATALCLACASFLLTVRANAVRIA